MAACGVRLYAEAHTGQAAGDQPELTPMDHGSRGASSLHNHGSTHRRFAGKSRGHALCLNPQLNPQNLLSCPTSAYLGSPRGLVSRCKTYRGSPVTAEVAGSSPVVPAISQLKSMVYGLQKVTAKILRYATVRNQIPKKSRTNLKPATPQSASGLHCACLPILLACRGPSWCVNW